MKTKTAAFATANSSTTEASPRRKNSTTRQERIQAFLVVAILLGIVVTIFAPRLHAFAVGLFTALTR